MPPLNEAWNSGIIVRPIARSFAAPDRFIATSTMLAAPSTMSTRKIGANAGTKATTGPSAIIAMLTAL